MSHCGPHSQQTGLSRKVNVLSSAFSLENRKPGNRPVEKRPLLQRRLPTSSYHPSCLPRAVYSTLSSTGTVQLYCTISCVHRSYQQLPLSLLLSVRPEATSAPAVENIKL